MLTDKFLEYLQSERNCSPLTVKSYGEDLRRLETFFKGMDEDICWETLDTDIIREWMIDMLEKEGLTANAVSRKLSAVRTFYHYLLRTDKVVADPTARVKRPKKSKPLPYFLKEKEMDQLLDETSFEHSFRGQRDRLILLLFYTTGMRIAELTALNDRDVDFSARLIKVTGKRDKQRLIPFHHELEEEMRTYLAIRTAEFDSHSDGAFLLSTRGRRISRRSVEYIVHEQLSKTTAIAKRSPHVLRHTFATNMLNNGADLVAIKNLLGHESLSTTEVYTHTSFEELRKTYQQSHPRTQPKK